jgi:hypothetical protein
MRTRSKKKKHLHFFHTFYKIDPNYQKIEMLFLDHHILISSLSITLGPMTVVTVWSYLPVLGCMRNSSLKTFFNLGRFLYSKSRL